MTVNNIFTKILSETVFLFILGGSLGWLCELIFRRIVHHKWINPGFLVGPCLPLYASGVLLLYGMCELPMPHIGSEILQTVIRIVIISVSLTAIEYVTGLVFTRVYRVRLWDYSDRPGNIDGIICPLFSLIWAAAGAAYLLFLHPYLKNLAEKTDGQPLFLFAAGIYIGIFAVDVCYSLKIVSKIKQFAKEQQLQIRYEHFKLSIAKQAKEARDAYIQNVREFAARSAKNRQTGAEKKLYKKQMPRRQNFVFPLGSPDSLRKKLENYLAELRK